VVQEQVDPWAWRQRRQLLQELERLGLIAVAGCASKLSVFDASKTPRRSEVFGFTRESQTF